MIKRHNAWLFALATLSIRAITPEQHVQHTLSAVEQKVQRLEQYKEQLLAKQEQIKQAIQAQSPQNVMHSGTKNIAMLPEEHNDRVILTFTGVQRTDDASQAATLTADGLRLPTKQGIIEIRTINAPYGPLVEYSLLQQQKQVKQTQHAYTQFAESSSMRGATSLSTPINLSQASITYAADRVIITIPKQ